MDARVRNLNLTELMGRSCGKFMVRAEELGCGCWDWSLLIPKLTWRKIGLQAWRPFLRSLLWELLKPWVLCSVVELREELDGHALAQSGELGRVSKDFWAPSRDSPGVVLMQSEMLGREEEMWGRAGLLGLKIRWNGFHFGVCHLPQPSSKLCSRVPSQRLHFLVPFQLIGCCYQINFWPMEWKQNGPSHF